MQTPPAVVASTLVPEALFSFMLKLPVLWIVSWVIVPTRSFQPQMAVAGRGLQGGPCSKDGFGRLGTMIAAASPTTTRSEAVTNPRVTPSLRRVICVPP
jgi:hypothetical protein